MTVRESDAKDAPAPAPQLLVARIEIGVEAPPGAIRRLTVASRHFSFPEAGRITDTPFGDFVSQQIDRNTNIKEPFINQ
jgi:hypothetical protein